LLKLTEVGQIVDAGLNFLPWLRSVPTAGIAGTE